MPNSKNIQSLSEIKDRVEKAQSMFLVDYTGLTHQQLEEMRRELDLVKAEVVILKNTLVNIAFQEKKIDAKEKLQGPHAVIFAYEDSIGAAKVLVSFNKKYSLPIIKFGIFSAKSGLASGQEAMIIDEGKITMLSTIPPKEVLLSKLLGLLNSPITSLVYDLNFNIQKLAQLLKAIEEKKTAMKST